MVLDILQVLYEIAQCDKTLKLQFSNNIKTSLWTLKYF